MKDLKQKIKNELMSLLNDRTESARHAIAMAKEGRDSDMKSSAGDKHETSRAMMQIEIENNEVQLSKTEDLKTELLNLNLDKTHTIVEPGSLVFTDNGHYYISIGIGKLELEKEIFYAISLASPIGIAMRGKSEGDLVNFQDKVIKIRNII